MTFLPLFCLNKQSCHGFEIPKTAREFKLEFKIYGNGHGPEGFLIRVTEKDSQSEQFCKTIAASLADNKPSVFLVPDRELVFVNFHFRATEQSEVTPVSWRVGIEKRQYNQLLEIDRMNGEIQITQFIHPEFLPACGVHFGNTQSSG